MNELHRKANLLRLKASAWFYRQALRIAPVENFKVAARRYAIAKAELDRELLKERERRMNRGAF